jgi:hypothetical protein
MSEEENNKSQSLIPEPVIIPARDPEDRAEGKQTEDEPNSQEELLEE